MENIIIDASTGHIGTSSMLLASLTPKLHPNSINRAINRTLEGYDGPKPQMVTIEGQRMFSAPIETCDFILDNMKDKKGEWDTWRQRSGQEFKNALRERVNGVLAALSNENEIQIPPVAPAAEPQPDEAVMEIEEIETKASILQKSLRSINIVGSVRIDEASGKASIIDVIKLLCPDKNEDYVKKTLSRVLAKDEDFLGLGQRVPDTLALADRVERIKINGKGHETPVSDAKTIVEIIWLLPAGAAKEFRRQSAETICRVLGGDVSLCQEIEQRCSRLQSTEDGRAFQSFVTDQGPAKKQRDDTMPNWFEYATAEEKRAYISKEVAKSIALSQQELVLSEINVFETCKEKLESVGHFDQRDKIEFADRVKDVQQRATRYNNLISDAPAAPAAPATNASDISICMALPIDDTIDPETGVLIATPKCSPSVRGPETSICVEAAKMGISIGDKAGQIGKIVKRMYSERYGEEAGRNIPKRSTTFRGKPFNENTYFSRDSDLIQRAIRLCVS